MTVAAPRLEMTGVEKRFGAVAALGGVDLTVLPGEVHALVGENGAGKSTLMKVLSGAHAPDAGSMKLDGNPFTPTGPLDALRRGVAMIYQELNLAPDLSVAANIMLGREPNRFGVLSRRRIGAEVSRVLELVGSRELTPDTPVASLGPGARQLVEIARALVGRAEIVVMDEPTSSLSRTETETLFQVVARLRDEGVSVIYISHFLEEVKEIADRYTVLRDGRTVATGDMKATTLDTIVEQMVGRKLDEVFPRVPHEPGPVLLSLAALSGTTLPREANLELRRGEILGVAGLVGAGRTELVRAIFGLDPIRSGRVRVASTEDTGAPPWTRLGQGVGLLSENRKDEGLALRMSIADNTTLSHLQPVSRFGVIGRDRQETAATKWIERLAIKCRGAFQTVGALSGGNQQKVALSRLLHHDVDVLLLDEPTRGIDVGSKVEVYRLMGELAASGKAILFISSYAPELLGVCDRIAVMHRGTLGIPRPVNEWTELSIVDEASRGVTAA